MNSPSPTRHSRARLLRSACASALILGAMTAATPAAAQALGGSTVIGGDPVAVVNSNSSTRTTTVTVRNSQAVIDWNIPAAGSAEIPFLPQGSTLAFESDADGSNLTDYTVLNRLYGFDVNAGPTPTGAFRIDGAVVSTVASRAQGGNIWFYGGNGIIAGSTATFDVGSLILTANAIDTSGPLANEANLYGPGNTIRFRATPGSTAAVDFQGYASAPNTGSYIAMVAPRVVQSGRVNANGAVAYVGAESADIRINGGLFDIDILADGGTTDAEGVVHNGRTYVADATNQHVYMVAVPKNNALTMLLAGNVGYAPASSAVQDGSTIVLSAGYDVVGGAIDSTPAATPAANISMPGATFKAPTITAHASGTITVDPIIGPLNDLIFDGPTPPLPPAVEFIGTASLQGDLGVVLNASADSAIYTAGDLFLTGGKGAGGSVSVTASGAGQTAGFIGVDGTLAIDVSAVGGGTDTTADAIGGTATLDAKGGTISAAKLTVNATAFGGIGTTRSGNATGGNVTLTASAGGALSFAPLSPLPFDATVDIDASAAASFDAANALTTGGNATGGTVRFDGLGGTLSLDRVVTLAQATGGVSSSGAAGTATGGNIIVTLTSGVHNWTSFRGDVSTASGYSGTGTFGTSIPGSDGIRFDINGTGTALEIAESISLYADATSYSGGTGGAAIRAGNIAVTPHDGGRLTIAQDLFASAQTRTAQGGIGSTSADATGGTITLSASAGTFEAGGLTLLASAFTNDATTVAGVAKGGAVTLFADRNGAFTLDNCAQYSCSITADAAGASGQNGSNATGGDILLYAADDADIDVAGTFSLSANGRAGASSPAAGTSGVGGNATGGTITIESRLGPTGDGRMRFGGLFVAADGLAGDNSDGITYNFGNGGTGTGGTIAINVIGGTLSADTLSATAYGFGGASFARCTLCTGGGPTPFQAGEGVGGTVSFTLLGGIANITSLSLSAPGEGGIAGSPSNPTEIGALAGLGRGGNVTFDAVSGGYNFADPQITEITLGATGTGGFVTSGSEAHGQGGGIGTGGYASFLLRDGTDAVVNTSVVTVRADGIGGTGGSIYSSDGGTGVYRAGDGGDGNGGIATVILAGAGALNAPNITLSSAGTGGAAGDNAADGDGGFGGDGLGGQVLLKYLSEGHAVDAVSLSATGTGGAAGRSQFIIGFDDGGQPVYDIGPGRGGNGGNGTGGYASFAINVDPVLPNLTIDAAGIGADGGDGAIGGDGGIGTGGTLGTGLGAVLDHDFGALSITGTLRISAAGFGGNGGAGYDNHGGRGGDAQGGDARLTVSGTGTLFSADQLFIDADAIGGAGGASGVRSGDGIAGADGGFATGGTALLSASAGGTITLGSATVLTADAIGGAAALGALGQASGANGGNGGGARGGFATLTADGGSIASAQSFAVSASATGANGARGLGILGNGGAGGSAQGGDAIAQAFTGGLVSLTNAAALDVVGIATGGAGGNGFAAGAGGNATGGTASLLNSDGIVAITGMLLLSSNGLGGAGGGDSANFGVGGIGGQGQGGITRLTATGSASDTSFGDYSLLASAFGGNAGQSGGSGRAGAAGGYAIGGFAQFEALDGARMTIGASGGIIADAFGGTGSAGIGGGLGGAGGRGGDAALGLVRMGIDGGYIRTATGSGDGLALSASSTGGSGGAGGDGSLPGQSGGVGGNGGDASGGNVAFDAVDGDYALGLMRLYADATGGGVGLGGAPQMAEGVGGFGAAGLVSFTNSDGGAALPVGGLRQLAGLEMHATGKYAGPSGLASYLAAGAIALSDTSTAAGGGLAIAGTLIAQSFGITLDSLPGISIASTNNAIRVGDAFLDSDKSVAFAFAGTGALAATGTIRATSNSVITLAHSGQGATPTSSLSATAVTLEALGDITASAGSLVAGSDSVLVNSYGGSVALAGVTAGNAIDVNARQNVTIGNASATGPVTYISGAPFVAGGAIRLTAGSDFNGGFTPATLTITGLVSATGSVLGQSGGDIAVATGAAVRSNNRIQFEAADDIRVASGASLSAALSPVSATGFADPLDDPAALYLSAGNGLRDLANPGYASILVDGSLSAPGRPIVLIAEAIQADANPIQSGSLYASILRAPVAGAPAQGDDTALATDCLRGNICLGPIAADNVVRIGPETGATDMPNRVKITGGINADDVVIRARDGLRFTGAGQVVGGTRLFLTSLTGDLDAASGVTLAGGDVRLFAGGSINGAGASVTATGAVRIGASGNVTLANLTSVQLLGGVDAGGAIVHDGTLVVPGALTISDTLRIGAGSGGIDAATISIGSLFADSQTLAATGNVRLDNALLTGNLAIGTAGRIDSATAIDAATLLLTGTQGIAAARLASGGTTLLTATGGDIVVTDLASAGAVTATGRGIDLTATGAMTVAAATASAGDIILASQNGPLILGTLSAARDLFATATAGAITQTGTAQAGRDIGLEGSSISAGTLIAGDDITVNALSGPLTLTSARTTGVGLLDTGVITLTASGLADIGTVNGFGDLSVIAATIGGTRFDAGRDMTLRAAGNITVTDAVAGGTAQLTSSSGTVSGVSLTGGTVAANGAGGVSFARIASAGTTTLDAANGAVLVSDLTSAGAVLASGQSIDLTASGPLTVSRATATAGGVTVRAATLDVTEATASGGDLDLTATGAIAIGTASATGVARATSSGGAISGTSLNGASVAASGNSGVSFARVTSGGATALTATNGAVLVSADLASAGPVVAQGRSIDLTALGTMTIASASATAGDISLQAQQIDAAALNATSAIDLSASNALSVGSANAGTTLTLASFGNVSGSNLTGQSIGVSAGGDATLGAATATQALTITASGTARFLGQATGATITVNSGDIALQGGSYTTGRLGVQGVTTAITLNALSYGSPVFIGGGDSDEGYSLSADEMTRLFATNIDINAIAFQGGRLIGSSGTPNMFVDGFTLTAGPNGNLGSGGTLSVTTPGALRVLGDVRLTGLGAQGGLTIRAGDTIEVIAGSGSIDLRDGNGGLGGLLTLTTADFIAATLPAIDAVAAADTLDARDERLALNDGVLSDDGMIRAGAIRIGVTNGAYIQNSGAGTAFASRRGFTANSLSIATEGSGTEIIINGRLTGANGSFITGLQTIPLVVINDVPGGQSGGYASGSTINGCLIASPGSCAFNGGFDNRDVIDRVLDPTIGVGNRFPLTFVELRDFVAEGYPPLIDEPVTGAGNDDLWDRKCDDSNEQDAACGVMIP